MKKFIILTLTFIWANYSLALNDCMRSCSSECVKAAQQILNSCGENIISPQSQVALYSSDSCESTSLTKTLRSTTDCESWSWNGVWNTRSIKIGGNCIETEQEAAGDSCLKFKAAGSSNAISFYSNDDCDPAKLVAAIDENTVCRNLSNASRLYISSVGYSNGKCKATNTGIKLDLQEACMRYYDF